MDKGLIMSLTGEQEHLIAADFLISELLNHCRLIERHVDNSLIWNRHQKKMLIIEVKIELTF